MGFSYLRFYQFRNIRDCRLEMGKKNVCFVGRNGQGKTNVLEAVYLLCYGSSFRTKQESLLIQHGSDEMSLSGHVNNSDNDLQLDVRIQNNKKSIFVDDCFVADRRDIVENVPCIVFCHDDIDFVNGTPDKRRWFFNQTMSMGEPLFINYLRTYSRILKSRNQLLKETSHNSDLLEVYDTQLAEAGIAIQQKRKLIIDAFNKNFENLFQEISELPYGLLIDYKPSWTTEDGITGAMHELKRKRDTDIRIGTTTTGPHRDKMVYTANASDFTLTASTGQLRLLSLILRVAQARYIAELAGIKPVLLLDDVLLELDPQRRKKFMLYLPQYLQAFYTFLPDEQFSQYISGDTLVYEVKNGEFGLQ